MSTEAPRAQPATTPADDAARQEVKRASSQADTASDATPSEQRATATWVEATDASGTVRSKREMPEPDSPGG